jgi:hypothetical protein
MPGFMRSILWTISHNPLPPRGPQGCIQNQSLYPLQSQSQCQIPLQTEMGRLGHFEIWRRAR